ncbi:MAG: hypothetical protein HDT04_03535 [Bacteroidales bacterium]|nr:hypothetical protein [Bacteroidales bacterium]
MKKSSTQKSATVERTTPRASTLARIRQFARVAAVISPALPPVVLN